MVNQSLEYFMKNNCKRLVKENLDFVSIRRFTIAASEKPYRIGSLFPFIMHCFSVDFISDSFHYAAIVKVT